MAFFDSLEKEERGFKNKEGTEEYETIYSNELEDGDTYSGDPFLTNIQRSEFEDEDTGEMKEKFRAVLFINDHQDKETLQCNVNFKSLNDKFTAWEKSMPYDIIDSIEELHEPGVGGKMNVYSMSFKELQKYVNNLGHIVIKIRHHNGDIPYNTVRITDAKAAV